MKGFASKQQAASKQAASKQQASTSEMGGNHISVAVLQIRPKFSLMLPMGVKDNHTKYGPETQQWRPGTGVASAGLAFQNLQFRAKSNLFLPKTALEPDGNGQMKGNSGYSTHAARLPCAKGPLGPSNYPICPRTALRRPPKAQELVHIGHLQPQTNNKPYLGLRGSKRDPECT